SEADSAIAWEEAGTEKMAKARVTPIATRTLLYVIRVDSHNIPAYRAFLLAVAQHCPWLRLPKVSLSPCAFAAIPVAPSGRIVRQIFVRDLTQGLINPHACRRIKRGIIRKFEQSRYSLHPFFTGKHS